MISYELCKKLKDAGFPQTSDLFYCKNETWEEETIFKEMNYESIYS